MDSRDAFPTVQEWKSLLWQSFAVATGIAVVLIGLSAVMNVIFLVGILYGVALLGVVFYLASVAMRVEYGEPADPIEEENALAFPFTNVAGYPQLLLSLLLAGGTIFLAPTIAHVTGNMDFSGGGQTERPDLLAGFPQERKQDTPAPKRKQDTPAPKGKLEDLPADFPPGNVRIKSVATSSDWAGKHVGGLAFDLNARTYWNSGKAPPGWIEADLGKPTPLAELRMIHYTFPATNAIHEVWISDQPIRDNRSGADKCHVFDGFVRNKQILRFTFPQGTSARYVQINTTKSRSWPSWFEIAIDSP